MNGHDAGTQPDRLPRSPHGNLWHLTHDWRYASPRPSKPRLRDAEIVHQTAVGFAIMLTLVVLGTLPSAVFLPPVLFAVAIAAVMVVILAAVLLVAASADLVDLIRRAVEIPTGHRRSNRRRGRST